MSEAELHVLYARLWGGILNKARRGALQLPLPIGLAYREDGRVVLDPDQQIQQALRIFFDTFQRTGSASATVRDFRQRDLRFPHRVHGGPRKGEVVWRALDHSLALGLVHNPRYAGAFAFGRTRTQLVDGKVRVSVVPRKQWIALYPSSHEGYISWEQCEENLRRLRENAQAYGSDRPACPPREGPALLQGLAICGRCGERLGLHYHHRRGRLVPDYVCQHETIQQGRGPCQIVPGGVVDASISALLIQTVTP